MGMPPTIEVASLGWEDSLILMLMALVVFGPRRLPEFARQLGKLMYEVRKASSDFKFQMEQELRQAEEADRRKKEAATQPTLAAPASAQSSGTIEAVAGASTRPQELPTRAEIDALFQSSEAQSTEARAAETKPAEPVSGADPKEAAATNETTPNTSPNQEQAPHG
jgi:sec-independent protein translocase protein TatB